MGECSNVQGSIEALQSQAVGNMNAELEVSLEPVCGVKGCIRPWHKVNGGEARLHSHEQSRKQTSLQPTPGKAVLLISSELHRRLVPNEVGDTQHNS
eukprot:6206115-Pleurochrysis_carterae.AAC.1